ncbi:uncharacterized protein LOC144106781 [Amblyomma americanum]
MLSTTAAFLIIVPMVIGDNHTATNQSALGCDVDRASWCYWEVAYLFGTEHLLLSSEPGADKKYLTELCNRTILFPTQDSCKSEYAQCPENEKQRFESMERGYSTLQKAVTNENVCSAISHLNKCVNKKEMKNCQIHYHPEAAMGDDLRRSNYEWSLNLSNCMEHALKKCAKDSLNVPRMRHLRRIIQAVMDLVWYDGYVGSVTQIPTEEAANSTEPTPVGTGPSCESTEEMTESSTKAPLPTSTEGTRVSTLPPYSLATLPAASGLLKVVVVALILSRMQ